MEALKVTTNNKTKTATIDNGTISIIVTQKKNKDKIETDLSFSGIDKENNSYQWIHQTLKLEDKIEICLVETDELSKPIKERKINPDNTILEGKIKAYNMLKKDLEDQGVI